MAEIRRQTLARILASHRYRRAMGINEENATAPGQTIEGELGNLAIADQPEENRAPLAAGPLTSDTALAGPATSTDIQPVHVPAIPVQGEIDFSIDPRCGEPAPLGVRFCPFLAVVRMPYMFVGKRFKQPVASTFFDAGKVWNRPWDLAANSVPPPYYIWNEHLSTPVTLVTQDQFQVLIDEINAAFPGLNWAWKQEHEEGGLLIEFASSNANFRPRWLGHSNSREKHDYLCANVENKHVDTKEVVDLAELQAFQDTVRLAHNARKNKRRKSRDDKPLAPAMVNIRAGSIQLDHVYHYLGLSRSLKKEDHIPAIDCSDLKKDVIFIAIDIEAYERAQHQITEVGISTLDTRDLQQIAMGHGGSEWRKAVRGRHFIVKEHKHLKNKKFVKGCPDKFHFGESEIVPLAELAQELAGCFKHPYNKLDHLSVSNEQRHIVLVGHSINDDINYCHQLGFSILNRSSIIEVVDTAVMFRAHTKEKDPRSLGKIMVAFDLEAPHLHNAGNDAVYTLWALLSMCCIGNLEAMPEDSVGTTQ